MSALRLTSDDLTRVAGFLDALSAATNEFGVTVGVYGPAQLRIGDTTIAFDWDEDARAYVLSDRVGD